MAKMIHKPNNKYFKLFRKTDVTMRFPEVNNVLDIWPKTKYFLILTEEKKNSIILICSADWWISSTNYVYHDKR